MTERKEQINLVQIACLVVGFVFVIALARFLGYNSILASAIAGALGALLGTVLYQVIVLIRR